MYMTKRNLLSTDMDLFPDSLFPINLPEIFKEIYYYLYSNSNIPRAERLGNELIKILFCKIYEEVEVKKTKESDFIVKFCKEGKNIGDEIKILFEKVKKNYSDVFNEDEKIYLDDKSINYIVEKLKGYKLTNTDRDVITEAFQSFWGSGLRGEKGQFFTPKNVVKMCVDILEPQVSEKVLDPACGSGGFLIEVLSHFKKKNTLNGIYGIDKEIDLVKICKAYMSIVGGGPVNIFCADSLYPEKWSENLSKAISDNTFDIILTNPPFGAKIFIDNKNILKNYELGHKWVKDKDGFWKITPKIEKQVPQVLFIERCLQLLKYKGRMAIVLPDGVFGNPRDRYVWEFILKNARILAIISLPPETFLPSTHTKTSVMFLEKRNDLNDYEIFMAIAKKVGHDKNGKIIYKMDKKGNYIFDKDGSKVVDDDLPSIVAKYKQYKTKTHFESSHLGFIVKLSEIINHVYIPSYYDPETKEKIIKLKNTGKYKIQTVKELIDNGIISIKRGHEVGSKYYGMGNIPFVRTSDIVNWEIKIDPVKCIPEEIYEQYKRKQDIRENDILLITDGTFLIGRTAIVTPFDKKIVIQSHIRRIRCLKPEILHPYLLLFLLNSEIVQEQIEEKTFVQATISTIGERLLEISIPIPIKEEERNTIIHEVSQIINMKIEVRKKIENLMRNKMES